MDDRVTDEKNAIKATHTERNISFLMVADGQTDLFFALTAQQLPYLRITALKLSTTSTSVPMAIRIELANSQWPLAILSI